MNYLNGTLIFFVGIFIGVFYRKILHKFIVLIRNIKEDDMNKKDDDLQKNKDTKNIKSEDEEEIDFEEEDLKMV